MYLWIKALHIIAVISWMAGLLYLPRLMVYHCDAERGSRQSETFKVMERRLFGYIMRPAMIVVWLSGLALVWISGFWAEPWMWAKFALVLALSAFNDIAGGWVRAFNEDRNTRTQKFYRVANEVPTAIMIVIVVLVIVKPF
ncbi:MAG: protoporphyrinogen oxidase HemJ [Pseudomonadota bacterium]|jgi:putative membrane protein